MCFTVGRLVLCILFLHFWLTGKTLVNKKQVSLNLLKGANHIFIFITLLFRFPRCCKKKSRSNQFLYVPSVPTTHCASFILQGLISLWLWPRRTTSPTWNGIMTTKKSISISSSNPFDISVFNLEVKNVKIYKKLNWYRLIPVSMKPVYNFVSYHDIVIRLIGDLQGMFLLFLNNFRFTTGTKSINQQTIGRYFLA